jgi:hypothetical protein
MGSKMILKGWIGANRLLLFFIASGFVAITTRLDFPLTDTFHEGEYVGNLWHMGAYYLQLTSFPLLIHGAMDYIPSLIALNIFGDSNIIIGTRAINTFLAMISWVLFMDICALFTRKSERDFWSIVAVIVFFILSPPLYSTALSVQKAFLGPRDVFLLATIWTIARAEVNCRARSEYICLSISAMIMVTSFYWCYDRGIIGGLFMAFAMLRLLLFGKFSQFLVLTLFSIISLVVIEYAGWLGSFAENVENIVYWVQNSSEVWGWVEQSSFVNLIAIFPVSLFLILGLILILHFRAIKLKPMNYILIAGIIGVQILLFKTVYARIGAIRIMWAIWPSIVLLFYIGSRIYTIEISTSFKRLYSMNAEIPFASIVSKRLFKIASYIFLGFMLLSAQNSVRPFLQGRETFRILLEPPTDNQLVRSELREVSQELKRLKVESVFSWTNEGVLALLAKKPYSTRYPYAVYASPGEESKMLSELIIANPIAIVINSTNWSTAIDGKEMKVRLPNIHKYITEKYPISMRFGSYTLVKR